MRVLTVTLTLLLMIGVYTLKEVGHTMTSTVSKTGVHTPLPPIDTYLPEKTETATFAFG